MAKAKKSFETMLAELEEIVREMEQGGLTLDETLKRYGTGVELLAACREKLDAAAQALEPRQPEASGEESHD